MTNEKILRIFCFIGSVPNLLKNHKYQEAIEWKIPYRKINFLYSTQKLDLELIPKLEICFLGLVFLIFNQAQDHENIFETH